MSPSIRLILLIFPESGASLPLGDLHLPSSPPPPTEVVYGWGDSPAVWVLCTMCVVAFIPFVGRLVELIPALVSCLDRSKSIINLEDSVSRTRERNTIAVILFVPLCLLLGKYRILTPSFLEGREPLLEVAGIVAVLAAYLALRWAMAKLLGLSDPHLRTDAADAARRGIWNFWIIGTLLSVLISALLTAIGVNQLVIKTIISYLLGILLFVFFIRRAQILASFCNPFQAFLYLCALEIVPLCALVAAGLFL